VPQVPAQVAAGISTSQYDRSGPQQFSPARDDRHRKKGGSGLNKNCRSCITTKDSRARKPKAEKVKIASGEYKYRRKRIDGPLGKKIDVWADDPRYDRWEGYLHAKEIKKLAPWMSENGIRSRLRAGIDVLESNLNEARAKPRVVLWEQPENTKDLSSWLGSIRKPVVGGVRIDGVKEWEENAVSRKAQQSPTSSFGDIRRASN